MKGLWFRLFLAAAGSTVLIWLAYEWIWLPYDFDRETEVIESELLIHSQTLKQQYDKLPREEWPEAISTYNQNSDNLLEFISDTDARWVELYSTLISKGEDNMFFDGIENVAVILLGDQRSLLRIEKIYFDQGSSLDLVFWLFVLLALAVSAALIYWVLVPLERRLQTVSGALDEIIENGNISSQLVVHGDGTLGAMETRLNRVSEKLGDAVEQWQESLSAQRDLLHAVAHEFRSPIARLRFAQDMLAESSDPDERESLEQKMDASIAELDDLVREVLGYSRVRHGGYRLQLVETDFENLLDGICSKVRQVYPTIEIVVHCDNERYQVFVDARLAERAIINVIRNAARYATRRVDITLAGDATHTKVIVNDDGPGIAPGKRDRIFEPFTRLDASRSRDSGGSGLGLAIVRAIMDQHAGSVTCEESKTGGASFVLTWPLGGDSLEGALVGGAPSGDSQIQHRASLK